MSVSTGNTRMVMIDGVPYAPVRAEEPGPKKAEAGPLLLTIAEAAQTLGGGISTFQKLYLAGEIESVTFGRARRIVRASLERYVEEHKRGGA